MPHWRDPGSPADNVGLCFPMSALKETLISHNLRNEISDFDLCLTELLCELNSVDSPQQSISAPFFVSRHIARLKSDHTPNGELKSVTSEEMSYN